MSGRSLSVFSEKDVVFVIETVDPGLRARKSAMRESYGVMEKVLDDNNDALLERVASMEEERLLLTISPRLLFEMFLRRSRKVLSHGSYLLERVGRQKVPVFDAPEVGDFLSRKGIIPYLADMLVSFAKIESFTLITGVRDGVWQKLKLNTMDIDSLIRFCSAVNDDGSCFPFYKRIADVCLFITGIFPEFVPIDAHPARALRPIGRRQRSAAEYERVGKEYYERAAALPAAKAADLDNVMKELAGCFRSARKSLNFLTDILIFRKKRLFAFDG
jgi:hypothetical protein